MIYTIKVRVQSYNWTIICFYPIPVIERVVSVVGTEGSRAHKINGESIMISGRSSTGT